MVRTRSTTPHPSPVKQATTDAAAPAEGPLQGLPNWPSWMKAGAAFTHYHDLTDAMTAHELATGQKLGKDLRKTIDAQTGWIYCTHGSTQGKKGQGCSLCLPVRWDTGKQTWLLGDNITRYGQCRHFCL